MVAGIYTLGNDVVYDQLVALLNSIEVNVSKTIPVCVIAYDDRLEKVQAEIAQRPNVSLLKDPELFNRWERFSHQVWETHPTAFKIWQSRGIQGVNRLGMNRRYCAFDPDSPFEKFAYFDADILVLNSLDKIFTTLNDHPFVVYDFQYKDLTHIYNVASPKLPEIFSETRLKSEIFCAGFYGGKRGLFPPEQRSELIAQLAAGEAEVLYLSAPNQSVLNYMVMRTNTPVYNLALHLPPEERTGCSVTSPHFESRDNLLYDHHQPLTYLHYIGISAKIFNQVCNGENIEFPYRDLFLYYRYLHEPEKRPNFKGKGKSYQGRSLNLGQRFLKKLGFKG